MPLEIDLSQYSYNGKWFDFRPGVKLQIRPYPGSMDSVGIKGGSEIVISGTSNLKKFDHCLTGAEGLELKINGEVQELTPATKKIIFDFDIEGIATFVLAKIQELNAEAGEAEKK